MRANATQEISANFVIRPDQVRVGDSHSLRTHHLLTKQVISHECTIDAPPTSRSLRCISASLPILVKATTKLVSPLSRTVYVLIYNYLVQAW